MKKQTKWIIGVVVIILIGWLLMARNQTPAQENGSAPATSSTTGGDVAVDEVITKPVSTATYSYDGEDGKTALELLQASHQVATEQFEGGEFVTGIDGQVADPTKEYWAFYVNGELAPVGADSYKSSSADKIEWRLTLL